MSEIDDAIFGLLDADVYDVGDVTFFAQGKIEVKVSYANFVGDIMNETKSSPENALKLADAITTQIAVFGYSRAKLSETRVKIQDVEVHLPEKTARKLSARLQQGSRVEDYNPRRLCAFRAPYIRKFLKNSDASLVPNLSKKLGLSDDFKEFAFIGSEYAVTNHSEAEIVLKIAELLDKNDIKKDKTISQHSRLLRFFQASKVWFIE